MATSPHKFRSVLLDRRQILVDVIERVPDNGNLVELRSEVDSALGRLDVGQFGMCEVCGNRIQDHDLLANPLLRQCLWHLPSDEQRKIGSDQGLAKSLGRIPNVERAVVEELVERLDAPGPRVRDIAAAQHEQDDDIIRARAIQSKLLPVTHLRLPVWELFYEYIPAGALGGDYCDIIRANDGDLFVFFGDAMGKGIAASMIVARLHTLFRTLMDLGLSLSEMLDRANRIFCECVLASGYYATILCGRACASGVLEVVNAGHLPPLLLSAAGADRVLATGLPLGLFYTSKYEITKIQVRPGETFLCYTDGITEARNTSETEYGHERLANIANGQKHLGPEALVHACREDVTAFTSKTLFSDDFTILALRRVS